MQEDGEAWALGSLATTLGTWGRAGARLPRLGRGAAALVASHEQDSGGMTAGGTGSRDARRTMLRGW